MSVKPGLHFDMPNDDYHADTEYLSSTVLKRSLPERYKDSTSQDALDFGTLFHTVVLEPDRVDDIADELGLTILDPHVIGLTAKGEKSENPTATTAWKNKVKEVEASGKRIMTVAKWAEWLARAQAMLMSLQAHEKASELLFTEPGESEVSAFWQPSDGPAHKARFDRLLDGKAVDLKSTSAQPGEDALTRAVINYGYDLSAAHYLQVAEGLELGVTEFWFIFVGKEAPHYVTVCDLSNDFLTRGRLLRALAIERLTEDAPPYVGAEGHLTLAPPPYARITDPNAGVPADFTWSINDYA